MSIIAENPIALDFETYSDVNLAKNGLDNYVNSPYFQPLIACTYQYNGVTYDTNIIDFIVESNGVNELQEALRDQYIVAHNAPFEYAVLKRMGIYVEVEQFVDTAVLARARGFGGSLEACASQLLDMDKKEEGKDLIQLFCIPQKDQEVPNFNEALRFDHSGKWQEFIDYCIQDTRLSLFIAESLLNDETEDEMKRAHYTMHMNNVGWWVDLPLVEEMARRYEANTHQLLADFRKAVNSPDLNLNSHTQLMAWCKERGVVAKSFDEKNVASMFRKVNTRMNAYKIGDPQYQKLSEVRELLSTKQQLGGSSLKKLDTITRMVGPGNRLRNQYMHVGAAATYRTSGRGVQMQNLKRLYGGGDDVTALHDPMVWWTNDKMSSNLRQVFAAEDPQGQLIVGDFSSVESRGLAWQAGEQWKLDAYEAGEDLYKVQAAQMLGLTIDRIGKEERTLGKVGELACGYGAGPGAVKDFAEKMGVDLTAEESAKLVNDWRDANGRIVEYWHNLDSQMRLAIETGRPTTVQLPHGYVEFKPVKAPQSLRNQTNNHDLLSLEFRLFVTNNHYPILSRVIHGTYLDGRQVLHWKPSERKTGPLWSEKYTDPKTKKTRYYSVYGGKLAGLMTQSLCREMFFHTLGNLYWAAGKYHNIKIIGQFHDEIVMEWAPSYDGIDLQGAVALLRQHMTTTVLPRFPIAAEVNSARRYIK